MYEKQGTPPCGALNSYIWNKCIGEIADAIEDIALLRVEELYLLDGRGDSAEQPHRGISKEQLACAELRSIRLERTPVIAVDADTVYFRSEIFCEFQLHAIGGVPDEEKGKSFWVSCKLTLLPAGHRMEVLQVNPMVDGEYMREPLYPLPELPGVSANQKLLPDLSGMDMLLIRNVWKKRQSGSLCSIAGKRWSSRRWCPSVKLRKKRWAST